LSWRKVEDEVFGSHETEHCVFVAPGLRWPKEHELAQRNGSAAGYGNDPVEDVTATTHLAIDRSAVRRLEADEIDVSKSFVGVAKFENGTIR